MEIFHVCSLGSSCHTANIMKRNKLKLYSCAFDWIFSNVDNIIHCIEDDFKIFLDKSYYISLSKSISKLQGGHSFYGDNMWYHHDLLLNLIHYNYYIRCVNRFKQLLKFKEHKLFIMTFVNNGAVDARIKDIEHAVVDFNNKFSKHAHNYTLLVVFHIPNTDINHHTFTYIDNIHFLELHTISKSSGVSFYDETDNIYLDDIIKQTYNFNLMPGIFRPVA